MINKQVKTNSVLSCNSGNPCPTLFQDDPLNMSSTGNKVKCLAHVLVVQEYLRHETLRRYGKTNLRTMTRQQRGINPEKKNLHLH